MRYLKFFLIPILAIILIIPLQVEARKNIEDVGIALDRTCLALIKAEMKTNCPTYEDILLVYRADRYVDSRCHSAIISAEKWILLLGDTIWYLQSGCTKTNFDSIVKIYQKPMDHDPKSSTWYKYQQWLKNAKQISKDKFLVDNRTIYSPEAR